MKLVAGDTDLAHEIGCYTRINKPRLTEEDIFDSEAIFGLCRLPAANVLRTEGDLRLGSINHPLPQGTARGRAVAGRILSICLDVVVAL